MTSPPSTDLEVAEQPPALPAVIPKGAMDDDSMAMLWREAKALASSGMFKNVRQAEEAFGKLVIGHHLGVSPATAMTAIDIVEGNPTFRGTLLGTLVREREGYDWKVIEHTDVTCSIEFFRDGDSQGVSTFTLADAKRAELIQDFKLNDDGTLDTISAKKDNWRKYPKDMLWNRTMSKGVKQRVPETMQGIPVYAEGELDDIARAGAVDGEPGASRADSPATNMAKVELTIKTHVPDDQQDRALALIKSLNRLAPDSWGAGKIEMLLAGKTPKAIAVELDNLQRQVTELQATAAAAEERGAEEPEKGTDEPEAEEPAADSSPSNEAPAEPREPTPDEANKIIRLSELQEIIDETRDELTEQQVSDIEAEIDSLRGEIPPEAMGGQESLPL